MKYETINIRIFDKFRNQSYYPVISDEAIDHVKNNIKTELKCSPVQGIGVFTIKDIKKGEQLLPLWQGETMLYAIPMSEFKTFDEKVQEIVFYTYKWHDWLIFDTKVFIGMSRPKKKEINLSKDSILSLLQEVYNELVEQRSTALRVQNKMLALLKDPQDMREIGPVLEKQQKIINDVVEKKLTLAKLQSSIWEKSQFNEDNMNLTDIDDEMLQSLIQKDLESVESNNKYKMWWDVNWP